MLNGKTRSTLLGVIGAYLAYLGYDLFQTRGDADTTMTMPIRILFIVLFGLAGIALMVYSILLWKRSLKEEKEEKPDDPNSMK